MILRLLLLVFITVLGLRAAGLRVATYNLANYNSTGRLTEDGYHKNYPKTESSKQALHAVICSMKADILALQEMGSARHLEELQADLRNLGQNYPHAYLAEAGDETRHLALLSRYPLLHARTFKSIEFNYFQKTEHVKRGVLEVAFSTSQGEFTLWILHLKSRFTEDPLDPESEKRRNAEATAIRDLILRRHKDPGTELFCVLGDFNDGKNRRPLKAMQTKGSQEITHLLEARDSKGDRWTHFYLGEESYERFDHILVSPSLHRFVSAPPEQPKAETWIVDTPGYSDASDHRAVLVQFSDKLSIDGDSQRAELRSR